MSKYKVGDKVRVDIGRTPYGHTLPGEWSGELTVTEVHNYGFMAGPEGHDLTSEHDNRNGTLYFFDQNVIEERPEVRVYVAPECSHGR